MSKLVKISNHTFLGISLPGFYGNDKYPSPIIGVQTLTDYKSQLHTVEDTFAFHIPTDINKNNIIVNNYLIKYLKTHKILHRTKAIFFNKLTYNTSKVIFMYELANSINKPIIILMSCRKININNFINNHQDNLDYYMVEEVI